MKNKIFIIFILFVMFFITGCENSKKDGNAKVTNNSRELTKDEINNIMNIIDNLKYMDFYNKDIVPRTLTNQEILRISYEFYIEEGNSSKNLSFSSLEGIANKYLGFGLEPESLTCDTHFNIQDDGGKDIMIYDVNTGNYTYNSSHHNHSTGGLRTKVYNKYVSGSEDSGVYTVKINKLFSDVISDGTNGVLSYYKTYGDAKNKKNELFKTSNVDDNCFNEYADKLVEYTYVFNFIDGNYVLSSYTIG